DKFKDGLAQVMKDNTRDDTNNQKREFRDLLLDKTSHFYAYNGMVKTTVKGLNDFDGHRFSVSLKGDKNSNNKQDYNLVSSKIGDFDDEWFILFDQKEHVSGRINFDVEPEITHIEYDIHEVPGSEDIKQSTWIQLINPIPLKDKYSVKEWPKITREFPDKPVIVRHQATQQHQDGHKEIENWEADKIGIWNYELEIKDSYKVDDIIHIDLVIGTSGLTSASTGEDPNLEGFIAYWSSWFSKLEIESGAFKDGSVDMFDSFVRDFDYQFNDDKSNSTSFSSNSNLYSFKIKKNKSGIWKRLDNEKTYSVEENVIKIDIDGFNVFENNSSNRVITVLPKLKAYRNLILDKNNNEPKINPEFIYETETVQAENSVT